MDSNMGHFEFGKWVEDKTADEEKDDAVASGELTDEDKELLRSLDETPEGALPLPAGTKVTNDKWYGGEWKCSHKGTPVKGAPGLLGSSYRGGLVMGAKTLTVILTPEALELAIPAGWSTLGVKPFDKGADNIVYWPIKDMSTPPGNLDTVTKLVTLHRLNKEGYTVEVACFGGHGRTGMVLAVLAALSQNWSAEDAVRNLRAAYCGKAVETKGQERFVRQAVKACRLYMEDSTGQAAVAVMQEPAPVEHEPLKSVPIGYGLGGDELLLSRNARIRDMRDQGYTLREIGDRVGLSFQQVSKILLGKRP